MGMLSPGEQALLDMGPTWLAVDPVHERDKNLAQFLREELPPGVRFDAAGMTAALQLCIEFGQIWPHRVPECGELVEADRAGRLEEKIKELNEAFARGE